MSSENDTPTAEFKRIDPAILNFVWCLLVALSQSEQQAKKSPVAEHIFIMRWLENALKRKTFPKEIARELRWFIGEGHRLGFRAGLRSKAEYIWYSGTGNPAHLSDLRKVTNFFEALKMLGWRDVLVNEADWYNLKPHHYSTPMVYMLRSALLKSFDASEHMISPMEIKLNNQFEGVFLLAQDARLKLEYVNETHNIFSFIISPEQ